MSFGKTTPILRIFDEAKAREFYLDFLGFSLDWEHRFEADFPLYLQVSRGECVLHLTEHHGDCSPGAALRIETDELETFQQQLLAKQYRFSHPQIQAMPWGSQDMTISDPFGNRLVFTNAISV
ncbi:catechol 2,3-dioxygenase-like lactoylglutathione lyase family enzyme [Pseudomonas protegens]|jgi:catechol 2,3-dioxygenase-like lactoylglutathione lyase family enzyme|uniref:Bleomycin resistance protein n=1 Tax=Pseudomonas protegens (strain DSM 19095 / LMG 27888 / CFBP 6595 / CHA0) TaxID=1124983 RepID=A0A2C9EG01_PSEPH|nr:MULTISPECIES: glyoxalase superfamily protein [Pseudomonas]AGL82581.1 glyoxalase family protein [Pseudomonas protegens CHA0]MBP5112374.1 VOC family protein [Pseudomonas protegens]MDT3418306.1 catechol 2,3-dioxygenase-like lactoylglutathione lyase family enzyme [Pseudomonas protegens]MDX9684292.1 glyoxalase superfamily protein [Pseudomonas protegens]QTU25911.1 VOC family protein [Pseudomonas protegens]